MRTKKTKTGLGSTLRKDKANQKMKHTPSASGKHVSVTDGGDATHALSSYLEGTSLEDFLETAVLSGRQFVAEKENVMVIEAGGRPVLIEEQGASHEIGELDFTQVKVPRRPKWDASTSPAELNAREKQSFLDWRRDLAAMEATSPDMIVTPFEKNLEVWRQLWRVIERSDIIIQIVDARNPVFYRSLDLEQYVKDVSSDKDCWLIINKSDFLTPTQRIVWAKYFERANVKVHFFSAKLAQEELDDQASAEMSIKPPVPPKSPEERAIDLAYPILTRDGLLSLLQDSAVVLKAKFGNREEDQGKIKFGMVGFPNVGKSSVINAILGAASNNPNLKRVAVGATPGKTKHFQTMTLTENVMLCDCPGLVFPSFVNNKAEMILCGVLPIAQLRDHMSPLTILTQRIPKLVLEHVYKIAIVQKGKPEYASPYPFLESYAIARGYMASGKAGPDTSRSARLILKDYVTGRLLYCHPPQDLEALAREQEDLGLDFERAFDPMFSMALMSPQAPLLEDGSSLMTPAAIKLALTKQEALLEDEIELDEGDAPKKVKSKRLKKHGRKGRKGRESDPYGESNLLGVAQASSSGLQVSGRKRIGHHMVQNGFTRNTHPHHFTYDNSRPAAEK